MKWRYLELKVDIKWRAHRNDTHSVVKLRKIDVPKEDFQNNIYIEIGFFL